MQPKKIESFLKNIFNSKKYLSLLGLLFVITGLIGIYTTTLKFDSVNINADNNSSLEKQTTPFYESPETNDFAKDRVEYTFSGNITKTNISQNYVKINVDDCLKSIKVNSQEVDLKSAFKDSVLDDNYCGPDKDLHLNLGKFLRDGQNNVEIRIYNSGGYFGILWDNSWKDGRFVFLLCILNLGFLLIIIALSKLLKLLPYQGFIIFLGLVIREYYLSYTKIYQRAYDVMGTGHLGYIQYVTKTWQIPDPTKGWEYYQPPVYYFISAIFYKIVEFFNPYNIFTLLQFQSIIFFIGFLFVSALIIKEFLDKKFTLLATFLIAFWPSGIIHSVRVSNDVLYYFFFALSLYFLIKWQKNFLEELKDKKTKTKDSFIKILKNSNKYFVLTFVFLGISIATKLTGLILAPIIAFTWLFVLIKYRVFWKQIIKYNFLIIIGGGVLTAFAFLLNIYKKILLNLKEPGKYDWLITNQDGLDRVLFVRNDLNSYFNLGLETWLKNIYLNPYNDIGGRQFFFQYFFKSSLYGEFSYALSTTLNWAVWLNVSIFVIIIVLIVNFLTLNKYAIEKYLVIILNLDFSILAMIYLKNKNGCSCNQDFRFILPTVISIVVLTVLGIQRIDGLKYPVLKWLLVLVLLGFIFASSSFFWAISLPFID